MYTGIGLVQKKLFWSFRCCIYSFHIAIMFASWHMVKLGVASHTPCLGMRSSLDLRNQELHSWRHMSSSGTLIHTYTHTVTHLHVTLLFKHRLMDMKGLDYDVAVTVVEVYNEQIRDLLFHGKEPVSHTTKSTCTMYLYINFSVYMCIMIGHKEAQCSILLCKWKHGSHQPYIKVSLLN